MPDGPVPAARGLGVWLSGIAPAAARGEVTVALISDRRMRVLNRTFRGKDAVTDVLSFGVDTDAVEQTPRDAAPSLGDIVIAAGVAARQAREHGHAVGTELRLLALHGLLHLLGYDHDADEGRMARAESRLRRKAGLPVGIIARAGAADRRAAATGKSSRSVRR